MKNILFLFLILISTLSLAKRPEILVLNKRNTVALRNVIDFSTIKTIQSEVFKRSNILSHNEPIYLVLDTPGGSIAAGLELINSLKSIPQEIKTVTNFSASMGFITVQSLGERLILPTGTLMSHRAYFRVSGQVPGEFTTRYRYWAGKVRKIEAKMAKRLKISLRRYQALIKDEYWVDGADAVAAKAADRVVSLRCDRSLRGNFVETIMTLFGPVYVVWSACPLITTPLKIDFKKVEKSGASALEIAVIRDLILKLTTDKKAMVKDLNNRELYFDRYERYIKWVK